MKSAEHRDGGCACGTECDIDTFSRNNFFTGKLLLERDFVDEQRYMVDKVRHHHRRLHGWGVVCGLKVVEHEQDGCRDRFVCVEPGSAVDCCGHDIVVASKDCFDITTVPAVKALANGDATAPHTLQVCVRYTECGTEPIPVLYDECGCDDTRCLPNRILESFDIDVLVDPPATAASFTGPALVRGTDIGIDGATAVRANATDGLLYVLAGTFVHAVDPVTRTTLRSHDVGSPVQTFDVSPSGDNLYVTHDDGNAGLTLTVLRASDFTGNDHPVPNGQAPAVAAVAPSSGGYVLLVVPTGELLVYAADLESATPTPPVPIAMSPDRELLAMSPDGALAFTAVKGGAGAQPETVEVADLAAAAVSTLPPLAAGTQPSSILVVAATSGPQLIVADDAERVVVVDVVTPAISAPASLAAAAVDLDGAPWTWALESAGGMSQLQAVSAARIGAGAAEPIGPVVGFAGAGAGVTAAPDGSVVYVPYAGTGSEPGGIAVFDVHVHDCSDVIWEALDGCDDCDDPNCVVLATIVGYVPGFALTRCAATAD